MEILKGHHTGLTVRSIVKSIAFYRDLLGMHLVFSWSPNAPYIGEVTGYRNAELNIAVLKVPQVDFFIELLEYKNVEQITIDHRNGNPGIAHIAFQVDNLDQWFQFLRSKGVSSVSNPVTPTAGPNRGGRLVYMIDPDGYRVELIETSKAFTEFLPED